MKQLISLILMFIIFTGCNTGEDEVYIVPKNFTGYVLIIHDQSNGMPVKYEGKKRVYEIPENGVLKTQFKDNPGWTEFPEFYYGNISKENRIVFKADPNNIPNDSTVAYGGSAGNANKDLAGKETVSFKLYYIGNKTQIDSAYEEAGKLDIVKLSEVK